MSRIHARRLPPRPGSRPSREIPRLDNGIKPPKRAANAKTREEWQATRTLNGEKAKQRAAEIKAAYATHVASLKAAQSSAFKARSTEAEKLWNSYKADRKAVNDRYQPFIDAIWKSKRKSPPHPYTEQRFTTSRKVPSGSNSGAHSSPSAASSALVKAPSLARSATPCAFTMRP